jgi:hypothetical protein
MLLVVVVDSKELSELAETIPMISSHLPQDGKRVKLADYAVSTLHIVVVLTCSFT